MILTLSKQIVYYYYSYLSCPEKDDNDSDSTENTVKQQQLSQTKLPICTQIKSCLKKTSLNDYSDLRASTTTQFSDAKRGSDNKSFRMSLKFTDDGESALEVRGFALDCIDLKKRTLSSDMELNPTFGLRSKLVKKQPNTQAIPFKNSRSELKSENFILEEEEDEDLCISRMKTELITKQSRARSCSSIFSKLKEKLNQTNFLEEESD